MTTTALEITVLTADDLKALRMADTVILRHHKGVPTIEAQLDRWLVDTPRIYTAREQRLFPDTQNVGSGERARVIPVSGSVTYWDKGYDQRVLASDASASAFEMFHSAQRNEMLQTVLGLLKAGDALHVAFRGDAHNNDYVRQAHLHADDVRLIVTRGEAKMTFLLDVSVCADNTARMVRPFGG